MVVNYHIPGNFIITNRVFTSFFLEFMAIGGKNTQFVKTTLYIRQAKLSSIESIEISVVKNFVKCLRCPEVRKFLVIPII